MIWIVLAGCNEPTPVEPLASSYPLDDAVQHPEGVTFHADERAFFVGSLGHGGLTRIEADGTQARLYEPAEMGWSSLGMKVHGDLLLTCAVRFPSTPQAASALWLTDVVDGSTDVILLAEPPNNCNDVVARGDDVYLTDRETGRLHHVDLATQQASIWLEHTELEPTVIGNNGIVLTTDALLVGQYSPPRLLRVPLASPESLRAVDLDDTVFGTFPNGADGITWHGSDLVIAAHRRVVRLTSVDDWTTASATFTELEVGIAAVTTAEDVVYGLKGEVVPFVLGTPVDLPFEIFAL